MSVYYTKYHLVLLLLLLAAAFFNLTAGSVQIPVKAVGEILTGNFSGKPSWEYIILEYRLPKLVIACFVGMSLSVAGMMMQTLFENPMAEPYVLGVSSGASLGVAICILGGSLLPLSLHNLLTSKKVLVVSSLAGSVLVMVFVFVISQIIRQMASF